MASPTSPDPARSHTLKSKPVWPLRKKGRAHPSAVTPLQAVTMWRCSPPFPYSRPSRTPILVFSRASPAPRATAEAYRAGTLSRSRYL